MWNKRGIQETQHCSGSEDEKAPSGLLSPGSIQLVAVECPQSHLPRVLLCWAAFHSHSVSLLFILLGRMAQYYHPATVVSFS